MYSFNGKEYPIQVTLRKQKRIIIRVENETIKVSAPKYTTKKMILNVIEKHQAFIESRLVKTARENVIHYFGYEFQLVKSLSSRNRVEIVGNELIIYHTEKKEPKTVLYDFYKKELLNYLSTVYEYYCTRFNISNKPELLIHILKRAYGLYYKKKNRIVLSASLAKYDKAYIDLVLCHELTHYYYFDHQEKFHQLLDSIYPDHRRLQRQMNKIQYHDAY